MMIRALVLGLVALMALILGVLVLKKSKRRHDAKYWFFLVCLCLAVWSAGLEVFSLADNEVALDTASRWFYIASAVFCPALAIFTAKLFLPSTKSNASRFFSNSDSCSQLCYFCNFFLSILLNFYVFWSYSVAQIRSCSTQASRYLHDWSVDM